MFRYGCMRPHFLGDDFVDEKRVLHKNFSKSGPVVGYIDGQPIAQEIVDASGHHYRFAGVAPRRTDGNYDLKSLGEGEWIVAPGLVYA